MAEENPSGQRQTAVTTYLKSKHSHLFVFARWSLCQYSMAEENTAAQKQTAVTAYLNREQLLQSRACVLGHKVTRTSVTSTTIST